MQKAIRILDDSRNVDSRTRLLPVEICNAVVAKIDAEARQTDLGGKLAALLLACYPDFRAHDERKYLEALVKTFAGFPYSVGKAVVHPINGLPGRLKYNPKVADVLEALKAEHKRLDYIRANALSHIGERRRRERWASEEANYAQNTATAEARKEQVARALGRIPGMKHPMRHSLSGLTPSPKPPLDAEDFRSAEDLRTPPAPASDELRASVVASSLRPGPDDR